MAVISLITMYADGRQRRQPQLPAPARGPLDGDHRAAAGRGQHGAVDRHADHDVGGDVAVRPAPSVLVLGVDRARRSGRTSRAAMVKIRVRRLRSSRRISSRSKVEVEPAERRHRAGRRSGGGCGGGHARSPSGVASAVRAMNASSRFWAVISRSRAAVLVSRWRATASESRARDEHPVAADARRSSTPGMACSTASSAPGSVARRCGRRPSP